MAQGKETGRDTRCIGTQLTLEAVSIDADVERCVVRRCHVKATVREFDIAPVSADVLTREPAHECIDGVLDGQHMSAEVSRQYLKALAVGYFARLDFLQCRLDGRVHERTRSAD